MACYFSKMKIVFLFCVSFICASVTKALQSNIQEVEWCILEVHKEVNNSIVHSTKQTKSISNCASLCSIQEMNDRESFYYIQETNTCHCNSARDLSPENTNTDPLQYGLPIIDCLSWYDCGYKEDGVYRITGWLDVPLYAQCDMSNGGWTIIQKRFDGSVDFYRPWADYAAGFGDIHGEHWIGLDNIHHLTLRDSKLWFNIEAFPGVFPASGSATLDHFSIEDSTAQYAQHVYGYTGTCGDSFTTKKDGLKFTTFDRDNDFSTNNCAVQFKGGWWYDNCFCTSFNGRYFQAGQYQINLFVGQGLHWCKCWQLYHSAKSTIMKVRRK